MIVYCILLPAVNQTVDATLPRLSFAITVVDQSTTKVEVISQDGLTFKYTQK